MEEYTGERMIPEFSDINTFWEHINRYRFASQFAKGKRVLDIACGEGYGSAALIKAGSASLIGIEISEEVCTWAIEKYQIDARVGTAEDINLPDKSIDLIVSFETIEHLRQPEKFIVECSRILVDTGALIISTPNKKLYTYNNPFHYHEMEGNEFTTMIGTYFSHSEYYGQIPKSNQWDRFIFVSSDSPLSKIKGFWPLNEVRKQVYKFEWEEVSLKNRSNASRLILGNDSMINTLFDPYKVRRIGSEELNKFVFLIIVAGKSKI